MSVTARPPLVRTSRDRMVAGVAGGLADHFGVDRRWVRLGFVVGALVGVGYVVYLLAAVLMPSDDGRAAPASRFVARNWLDYAAIVAIAIGSLQLVRELASNWLAVLAVSAVASLLVLAVVAVLPLDRDGDAEVLPEWIPPVVREAVLMVRARRGLAARTIVGVAVAIIGVAYLLIGSDSWSQLTQTLTALVLVFAGSGLAFAPWIQRLATDLVDERAARIRDRERAEMAAHLHDSVLQTLALVQRNAHDPREVSRLARVQERELRDWLLNGGTPDSLDGSLVAAIDVVAAELEAAHTTAIEVVHVRDCALTERLAALVASAREAMSNAQRHSGSEVVQVYTEVDDSEVRVFVRDRGRGFVRDEVAADRGGISESIEGRMHRNGGHATIRSTVGSGTEVELVMPREVTR